MFDLTADLFAARHRGGQAQLSGWTQDQGRHAEAVPTYGAGRRRPLSPQPASHSAGQFTRTEAPPGLKSLLSLSKKYGYGKLTCSQLQIETTNL